MKKKQKRQSTPMSELHQKEWDFSTCPKDQLHWCSVYEHSRENKKVVKAVEHYRASGAWSDQDREMFVDDGRWRMAQRLFELFPEFPQSPFLEIPTVERRNRCAELSQLRSELTVRVVNLEAAV
jgi:hypothetical protein